MRNSLKNFRPSYRMPIKKQATIDPINPPIVEIFQNSKRITSLYPPWKYIIIISERKMFCFYLLCYNAFYLSQEMLLLHLSFTGLSHLNVLNSKHLTATMLQKCDIIIKLTTALIQLMIQYLLVYTVQFE